MRNSKTHFEQVPLELVKRNADLVIDGEVSDDRKNSSLNVNRERTEKKPAPHRRIRRKAKRASS